MTPQEQMQSKLAETGIPAKEIKCYGSQIMITAWSKDAADKWHTLLANFAKVRPPLETADYNKVNKNTRLVPSRHPVWRVWATV